MVGFIKMGLTWGAGGFLLLVGHTVHAESASIPQDISSKITTSVRQIKTPRQIADITQQLAAIEAAAELAEKNAVVVSSSGPVQDKESTAQVQRMFAGGARQQLQVLRKNLMNELYRMAPESENSGELSVERAGTVAAKTRAGSARKTAEPNDVKPNMLASWINARNAESVMAQVERRFEKLDKALADLDESDQSKRQAAWGRLKNILASFKPKVEIATTVGSSPNWAFRDAPAWRVPPASKFYPKYALYPNNENLTRYAYAGNESLLAAAPATPSEAQSCGYTTDDLSQSATDAVVSASINALAAQLNYSPIKIFEYVRNNIKYEPYYGSLKGAEATLKSLAGGPTDQASLLVALLRASNVPARYVSGVVSMADEAGETANGGRIARWVGAKSYVAAVSILAQGNIAATVVNQSGTATPNGVKFNHVWVEACLPYGHYRGAWLDNAGERWIPMDPSYKDMIYEGGGVRFSPVNRTNFLNDFLQAGRSNGPDSLVHEKYAQAVEKQVRIADPNATIQDVPYAGKLNKLEFDILPPTLPYEVVQFNNWPGSLSPETAKIPNAHRYKMYLNGLTLSSPFSVYMPDVALKRISLYFDQVTDVPVYLAMNVGDPFRYFANSTSNDVVGAWRSSASTSVPCQTVYSSSLGAYSDGTYVSPVIKIDGVSQPLSLGAPKFNAYILSKYSNLNSYVDVIALCSTNNVLNIEVALEQLKGATNLSGGAGGSGSACLPESVAPGPINCVKYNNIAAYNWHAIGAYGMQGDGAILTDHVSRLISAVNTNSSIGQSEDTMDATLGEFLYTVGLKYMGYATKAIADVGALDQTSGQSGIHLGVTSTFMNAIYVFDLPFAINSGGFLVDMKGMQSRAVDINSGGINTDSFLITGAAISNLESYVWQEGAQLDAVSTIRGLQFANEANQNIGMLTLASMADYNAAISSGALRVAAQGVSRSDAAKNNLYTFDDVKNTSSGSGSIYDLINSGFTVTLPKSTIPYFKPGWNGTLYIASRVGSGGGAATYAIDKYAGGYAGGPLLLGNTFNNGLNSDYVSSVFAPAILTNSSSTSSFINSAPIGILPASNGITSVSTLSGDPVNMVTGNLYHNDTDISIKGRGGFPLVFSRSYNSRNPEDGPLGFGWTHVFNARLKFYGVEGGQAKFSWIDGTGAEKFFATASHISGNITNGATIANPAGLFITFQRLSDGTYSIREKNGLTYKFASATGPSGVPGTATTPVFAALQSITDRKGNALSLSYAATTGCAGGTLLCTVTDAIGHTLSFTYSGAHITQIKDFSGRTYQYGYTDANNNLTSFKNPLAVAGKQNGVSFSYYTASDGSSLAHLMKQYTLPRGNGMKFEYYANGRVFRHTVVRTDGTASPDQVNLFTYNDFRRETVQTNERQGERRFLFDPFGNTVKVVDENGAEHSYTYDCTDPSQAPGTANCLNPYNRLSETNPAGYKTMYAYDSKGNITLITPPRGSAAATQYFDYNSFGQPRRIKDANGHWRIQRYDAAGNLTDALRVVASYTPPSCASAECAIPTAAQILEWTVNGYDAVGNLTSAKRVRDFAAQIASNTATSNTGPLVTYGFDTNKWNATTTSRIGIQNADTAASTLNTATLRYDPLGRLTSGVDADWYATQYSYDDLDRPLQATDRLGQLRSYQFDANGNALGQSLTASVNGVSTQVDSSSTRYDDSDRAIQSLDAGGFATAFTYDAAGNVLTVTNPDGYVVSFDYDAANRPTYAYDQEGHAVATKRDTSGRTRAVTDPNGNTTTNSYWDASRDGRLKQVSYPRITNNGTNNGAATLTSGRAVQYDHDAMGNVTSVTEVPAAGSGQANRTTSTTYDELDRPIRVVGPQYTDSVKGAICPVARNTYDTLGRLTQVAAGHTPSPCTTATSDVTTVQQSFAYDDFGRKVSSADGLGRTWRYSYDANNNVIKATDPKAQTTTYTWDTGHQLKTRTEQGGRTTIYTRNALGQVLKVTHPNVNYSYSYDAAHRLTSVTDSRGNKTLRYDWSAGGLLNAITDSDGRQTSYLYDPVGRLTGITAPNGDTLAYQFDAGGRLIQRSMPNGVSARFAYNEDNSLRQVVNRDTASHILTQHDYAYDGVGQRASLAEAFNDASLGETASLAQAYTYDELKRLTAVSASGALSRNWTYGYDPLGNRTLMGVSSGNDSQSATLQYDAANQLSKYTDGSGRVTPTPTYDANGNLTYDGLRTYTWDALDQLIQVSGGGSSAPISYSYDDSGRRIAKATAGTQTLWTYDGQDIYAEYTDKWTTPSAVYTSGGAIDDPVIRVATTGASSYGPALYYHADGLGTVVGLSNNQDSSTQLTVLDAWGVSLGGPPTPMAQYGYTGREPDETGLVYMRARYYSPELGRFVSRDPAGLQGGINAYAYCGNNPTNCTDPSGLMPQSALSSFVDSSYFGMGSQGAGLSPSIGPSPANFFTDTTVGRALGSMAAPIALFTPNNVNPLTGYIENFNGDNRAAAAIGLMTLGVGTEVRGESAAIKSLVPKIEEGAFSILDWVGYPAGVPRPTGPVNLINGADYAAARKAADNANRAIHRADPSISPNQIHEIQPVKFGGSPTDLSNKFQIDRGTHGQVTNWWNDLQRYIEGLNK